MRTIVVDLNTSPEHRWRELASHRSSAQQLADSYARDFAGNGLPLDHFTLDGGYIAEMNAIAAVIDRPPEQVQLANLYYDAMRLVFRGHRMGCTAFALDTPAGPVHARNLDWWTENNLLSKTTWITKFKGAAGGFDSVGWPGLVGVFSGVAKDRFAITLNAVTSDEPNRKGASITFLLRKVFETAKNFDSAIEILGSTPLAADCLLLITGTRSGEMRVLERSCSRCAVRKPDSAFIVVTNDYRLLPATSPADISNVLSSTACSRFDRAMQLAARCPPKFQSCFDVLRDSRVRMGCTVQHMVMQASTGRLEVRVPRPAWWPF